MMKNLAFTLNSFDELCMECLVCFQNERPLAPYFNGLRVILTALNHSGMYDNFQFNIKGDLAFKLRMDFAAIRDFMIYTAKIKLLTGRMSESSPQPEINGLHEDEKKPEDVLYDKRLKAAERLCKFADLPFDPENPGHTFHQIMLI